MFTTAGPSLSTSAEKSGSARVGAATGTAAGFAAAIWTGWVCAAAATVEVACEVENGNQSGKVHPATARASVAANTLSRLTSNFMNCSFPYRLNTHVLRWVRILSHRLD